MTNALWVTHLILAHFLSYVVVPSPQDASAIHADGRALQWGNSDSLGYKSSSRCLGPPQIPVCAQAPYILNTDITFSVGIQQVPSLGTI